MRRIGLFAAALMVLLAITLLWSVPAEGRAEGGDGTSIVLAASGGLCQYNTGYKTGYQEGWCFKINGCYPPITPIPPVPRAWESTYNDGYNRGFIDGRQARAASGG